MIDLICVAGQYDGGLKKLVGNMWMVKISARNVKVKIEVLIAALIAAVVGGFALLVTLRGWHV